MLLYILYIIDDIAIFGRSLKTWGRIYRQYRKICFKISLTTVIRPKLRCF